MQGEYITSEAWVKMLRFFKQAGGIYIVGKKSLKEFLEAVYWMLRTGAQWRELPERYGLWNSIYKRFNAWSKKGIWSRLFAFCIEDPDCEYISIDATIVRAHACAAGYGRQEEQALGRSRGGFGTKIHAKVDALGNPLNLILTPGQIAEVTQAKKLLGMANGSHVLGDRGYDSDDLRKTIEELNCVPVIPGRCNRIEIIEYDKDIYKERNAIECFFSKIKHFRRVFSRFDKSARNFMAFLSFAGAVIWLR